MRTWGYALAAEGVCQGGGTPVAHAYTPGSIPYTQGSIPYCTVFQFSDSLKGVAPLRHTLTRKEVSPFV